MTSTFHRPITSAILTALVIAIAVVVLFLVPARSPSAGGPFDQGPPASVDLLGGGR